MKCVVLYRSTEDTIAGAAEHFPAHQAHYRTFADAGTLLMIGPFADPQARGALAIFTTREAAEQFVRGDPFVIHGVVTSTEIQDWHEVLVNP